MQFRDVFVACVAIGLGVGAVAAGISGGRLVQWSGIARAIERTGGRTALVLAVTLLGIFLIGVGISLLNE